jgi:KUP system potassium uptake protein
MSASTSLATSPSRNESHAPHASLLALSLGALGVVYGDIGTSPLYAIKEIFSPATGIQATPENVIGAVSVVLWALMLVVTLKYVTLILRADNRGEGGILALTALATMAVGKNAKLKHLLLVLGLFGATLFYGDSVITPAVSVLGALEGLEVITPTLKPWVVPLTVVIMIGLFSIQRLGTGSVGKAFGPVLIVWFVVIGAVGLLQIGRQPEILLALNPLYAWQFSIDRGWSLFATIGAIALVLTGAEALYADMGHFGKRAIRIAWNGLVLPSLALNYMGQGALLITDPTALENPFYRMFPASMLVSVVILSTLATIIASQAVITGAYSMSKQAMQLGLLPRMDIRYTSSQEIGQIYIPLVNWILFFGVIAAVLSFGSSSALAGAYGIAVSMTMMITTVLTWFVIHHAWRVNTPVAAAATVFFLCVDVLLVSGCATKLLDGGWFPLALGLLLFTVMETWERGRRLVSQVLSKEGIALDEFARQVDTPDMRRSERTAIYAVGNADIVPQALMHNLKHNQVLHRRNVIMNVTFHEVPWVADAERVRIEHLSDTFWRVRLNFGFMDTTDVPRALMLAERQGLMIEPAATTYFLSRQTVVPTHDGAMSWWRENLFSALHRNAGSVASYFHLPENSVVELGTHVQI